MPAYRTSGSSLHIIYTAPADFSPFHTVADDILDVTASTEALGKTAGKDLNMDKTTYPKLLGLDGSRQEAKRLVKEAKAALEVFGAKANPLLAIADYIVEREN